MPPEDAFEQEFQALRRKYRDHLASLIVFLDQVRGKAAAGALDPQLAEALMATAHKCAGNGASYGFDAVSKTGGALDYYLLDHPQREPAAVTALIDAFRTALSEAVGDPAQAARLKSTRS